MSENANRLVSLALHEKMLDTRLTAQRAKRGLTPEPPEYRSIYADYAVIHREYVKLAMEGNT